MQVSVCLGATLIPEYTWIPFRLFCSKEQNSRNIFRNTFLFRNIRPNERALGYLKGTKFYLESKASFIDISSIASFKPFLILLLIAWLREYCTFSDSSVVNLNGPRLGSLKRKGEFIPLSSLVWGKSLTFCNDVHALMCAHWWRDNRAQ